jgi:NADPH:quinone reductase-like Zn-dependent oxidoreductase
MRSIVYSKTGAAEVLVETVRPIPPVHEVEVRVQIVVSSVNPTDLRSAADG